MKKKNPVSKLTLKKKTIVALAHPGNARGGGPIKTNACTRVADQCFSNLDTSPCISVLIACPSAGATCNNEPSLCDRCLPSYDAAC